MFFKVFIIGLAFLLFRCGYHEEKEGTETPVSITPTFGSIQSVILTPKCVRCHSGQRAPQAVDLTEYRLLMRGGAEGPIVVPGDPEASPFYQVLRSGAMPQGGPMLSELEIMAVYEWINQGARGGET